MASRVGAYSSEHSRRPVCTLRATLAVASSSASTSSSKWRNLAVVTFVRATRFSRRLILQSVMASLTRRRAVERHPVQVLWIQDLRKLASALLRLAMRGGAAGILPAPRRITNYEPTVRLGQ
jgi:hypothetical protein